MNGHQSNFWIRLRKWNSLHESSTFGSVFQFPLKMGEIRQPWEINGKYMGTQRVQTRQPLFFSPDGLCQLIRIIWQFIVYDVSKGGYLRISKSQWAFQEAMSPFFSSLTSKSGRIIDFLAHDSWQYSTPGCDLSILGCILSARLLILHRICHCGDWVTAVARVCARKVRWKRCGAWRHGDPKISGFEKSGICQKKCKSWGK